MMTYPAQLPPGILFFDYSDPVSKNKADSFVNNYAIAYYNFQKILLLRIIY